MSIGKPTRLKGLSAETKRLLRHAPDEHALVEFKRTPNEVSATYISALANTAALHKAAMATILIGYGQRTDKAGWSQPELLGLDPTVCSGAKALISSRVGTVQPEAPLVDMIEENTETDRPILRVTISPTSPPHHDQAGRRAKRVGDRTIAMSDTEMLRLLFDQSKGVYSDVARIAADLVADEHRRGAEERRVALEQQFDELRWDADDERRDAGRRLEALGQDLERSVDAVGHDLLEHVADLRVQIAEVPGNVPLTQSAEDIALDLIKARHLAAMRIALVWDTLEEDLIAQAQALLETPIDPWEFFENSGELFAWTVSPAERTKGENVESQLRAALRARSDSQPFKVDLAAARAQFLESLEDRRGKNRRPKR